VLNLIKVPVKIQKFKLRNKPKGEIRVLQRRWRLLLKSCGKWRRVDRRVVSCILFECIAVFKGS